MVDKVTSTAFRSRITNVRLKCNRFTNMISTCSNGSDAQVLAFLSLLHIINPEGINKSIAPSHEI